MGNVDNRGSGGGGDKFFNMVREKTRNNSFGRARRDPDNVISEIQP